MEKKNILTIVASIVILVFLVLVVVFLISKEKGAGLIIEVITDRQEYKTGESLKVKIGNNLKEIVCFSSCYPYYIQKQENGWESYHYVECPKENLAEKCVEPNKVKAFELTLPDIEQGIHRLAISACVGCAFSQSFKEDEKFYSNNFIVK